MFVQLLITATNETLNYFQTNTYLHDGTHIDAATINGVDGILYKEYGGNTYVLEDFMAGNPINIKRFGKNSAAIQKAINLSKKYQCTSLFIPDGKYTIDTTVTFNVLDNTHIKIEGELITSSNFTGTAIIIGVNYSAPNHGEIEPNSLSGLNIQGLNCSKSNPHFNDTNLIGIKIMNVIFSTIEIKRVTGFDVGALFFSDNGNGGISYNSFHLNFFHDNVINLKFELANSAGYINENIFYGGSFNHTSDFPVSHTLNVFMEHNSSNGNPYNNNRFFYPSFEDNSVSAIAAKITGDSNSIVGPRMENPKNTEYKIILDEYSAKCQVISKGFVLNQNSIIDLGKENSYETNTGNVLRSNSMNPVLTLQNQASSALKLYSGLDASTPTPHEVFYVTGEGKGFYGHSVYAEQGVRWSSSDGSKNDRGLFSGNGDPAVTANPGSLYVNNNGSDKMLWVKTNGSGSTGWKPIGTQAGALTVPPPASPVNAQDVWARLEDLENKLKAAGLLSS